MNPGVAALTARPTTRGRSPGARLGLPRSLYYSTRVDEVVFQNVHLAGWFKIKEGIYNTNATAGSSPYYLLGHFTVGMRDQVTRFRRTPAFTPGKKLGANPGCAWLVRNAPPV